MKKFALGFAVLSLMASNVFAAAFTPEVMKISAPANIQYSFDGSSLDIPVTLSGVGGSASLLIFTKNKAATISNVTNGFMGWHHVNKIDTCIFASPFVQLSKGTASLTWNGKDESGATVPSGDYTYYIWSFDNVTPRIQMTKHMSFSPWTFRTIVTHDAQGRALDRPVIYTSDEAFDGTTTLKARTKYKWVVGNDPSDVTLRETCTVMQTSDHGGIAFDPTNASKFWTCYEANNGTAVITKNTWVPNGASLQDEEDLNWGDQGRFVFSVADGAGVKWSSGLVTDEKDYLLAINADSLDPVKTTSELIWINISDGTELRRLDLSDWWVDINDGAAGGQNCGGPGMMSYRNDRIALGSHTSCINQLVNTAWENEDDAVLWTNGNGDIVGDHNWEETAQNKWVCNDYNVGPYKYNVTMDSNLFTMFPSYDMGAVSFGLYAPDGTGLGYMQFAGETASQKFGIDAIDYGSMYDGLYTTNNIGFSGTALDASMWFIASDSFKGTISNQVSVSDAAPVSFTVAQNSPNPFNPATTISFTLARAGKTTVEVYNVAGQKISTLVNGTLSAGSHSVTWNAAKFSAGVYFYTVKCGDFSKTMKMTLLK